MATIRFIHNERIAFIEGREPFATWRGLVFRVTDQTGDVVAIHTKEGCWGVFLAASLTTLDR